MKKYSIIYGINEETGEVEESPSNIVALNPGDCVIRKKQLERIIHKYNRTKRKAAFTWVKFHYNKPYMPDLAPANLTRLMVLIVGCNTDCQICYKVDVEKNLNLPHSTSFKLLNELINLKLIHIKNDIVHINQKWFSKGKIKTKDNFIRMYRIFTQELYDNAKSTSEHKTFSYIFKMIPYVNRQTNILCHNQTEQNLDKIIPMKFNNFCEIVDYDKTHADRLRKKLSSLRVNGELVIAFYDNLDEFNQTGKYAVVNPHLFFGGEHDGIAKTIIELFNTERINHLNKNKT